MRVTAPSRQRGMALLESLVAATIAALGVLGLLGLQMRTLADAQTSLRRSQAIRLIEDFSERARVDPAALGQIAAYVSDWDERPSADSDCAAAACGPAATAAYQLARWKDAVGQVLPGGSAKVFLAEDEAEHAQGLQRQLGIMISWRENEAFADAAYTLPLGIDGEGRRGSTAVACPQGRTCHLQYLALSARCTRYLASGEVQLVCAGP